MKFVRCYSLAFLALLFFGRAYSFVEVEKANVYVSPSLGSLRLLHSEVGFIVEKNGNFIPVKPEFIDKEIRNISTENLDYVLGKKSQMTINGYTCIFTKLSENELETAISQESDVIQLDEKVTQHIIEQLPPSSYIQIVQLSNGDYGLHVRTRMLGGGPGAGILIGGAIKIIGYSAIAVCGGPVGWGVAAAGLTETVVSGTIGFGLAKAAKHAAKVKGVVDMSKQIENTYKAAKQYNEAMKLLQHAQSVYDKANTAKNLKRLKSATEKCQKLKQVVDSLSMATIVVGTAKAGDTVLAVNTVGEAIKKTGEVVKGGISVACPAVAIVNIAGDIGQLIGDCLPCF